MVRIVAEGDVSRELLKAALESGTLTKEDEAASVLGVHPSSVSRMIHGGVPVTPDRLLRIVEYLGFEGLLKVAAHRLRVRLPEPEQASPRGEVVHLATRANEENAEALTAAIGAAVGGMTPAARARAIRETREAIDAQQRVLYALIDADAGGAR